MSDKNLGLTSQFWGRAKKMGLKSPEQLMWLAPARFFDYREPVKSLEGLGSGDKFYARLLVSRSPRQIERGPLVLEVTDGVRTAEVAVFGDTRPFQGLSTNSLIHLAGEIGFRNGSLKVSSPQIIPAHRQGRLFPDYLPGESGLNRITLAARIAQLLETNKADAVAGLEAAIGEPGATTCRRLGLPYGGYEKLLDALHQPATPEAGAKARADLELIAAYQSLRLGLGAGRRPIDPEAAMPESVLDTKGLIEALPFALSDDQNKAISEIVHDLARPRPMSRVLSGDVGSGKTVSYLVPAVAAQRAGRQVVIMMPSTVLAAQISDELKEFYPDAPVAKMAAGDKPPKNLDEKPIIVGTTAILHWMDKQDPRPEIDLVIIDEQQKLGMEQKQALMGPRTHMLEATATAIPRSQALASFGISDISRIEQMPVEKSIKTHFVDVTEKREVFDSLVQSIDAGGQVAVIYPQREEANEDGGPVSRRAVEQAQTLWEKHFPGQVGWIHGGLKPQEKAGMLDRMREGKIKVMIASSVIEIGVTIPNLKALMVVEADRYGATTLHQLRGRVARKGGEGDFFIMSSAPKSELKPVARERLELLARTNNGLEIAEADLRARGFGQLAMSGSEQAGFKPGYLPAIKVTPEQAQKVLDHLDQSNQLVRRMASEPAPF